MQADFGERTAGEIVGGWRLPAEPENVESAATAGFLCCLIRYAAALTGSFPRSLGEQDAVGVEIDIDDRYKGGAENADGRDKVHKRRSRGLIYV